VFALRDVGKLDVIEHIAAGLFADFILFAADALSFEQVEEALDDRIIPTVPAAALSDCTDMLGFGPGIPAAFASRCLVTTKQIEQLRRKREAPVGKRSVSAFNLKVPHRLL
jgi:hypothetical protein